MPTQAELTVPVLGPATDGGYTLIGLAEPHPELFAEMPWGTDRVLRETLRVADDLGLAPVLLPELSDVDRPEDLDGLPDTLAPRR